MIFLRGSFNLIWTESEGENNYSIYVYNNFITKINDSLIILADKTALSTYSITGLTNGTYYYVIIALNQFN